MALPRSRGVRGAVFSDGTLILLSSHLEEKGDGKNVQVMGCAFSMKSSLQILCTS